MEQILPSPLCKGGLYQFAFKRVNSGGNFFDSELVLGGILNIGSAAGHSTILNASSYNTSLSRCPFFPHNGGKLGYRGLKILVDDRVPKQGG